MFFLIQKYQALALKKYFRTGRAAKIITVLLFGAVFLFVSFGLYLFFYEGFAYINKDAYFRDALTLYVYELFLLFISFLVAVSALITALFALFRGRRDSWIMGAPGFLILPDYIFYRACLNSAWPLLIVALPALLAIRKAFSLNLAGLLLSAALILVYAVLLAGLAFLLIFFGGRLWLYLSVAGRFNLTMSRLTVAVIIAVAAVTAVVWRQGINQDLIAMLRAEELALAAADVRAVEQTFRFFPSHLPALAIFHWQNNDLESAARPAGGLLFLTALVLFVWQRVRRFFLPLWQKLQESGYAAAPKRPGGKRRRSSSFGAGPIGAIMKKEFLVTARDPRALLWLVFLVLVWLMQAGLNIVLARNLARYGLGPASFPALAQVLQLMTAVFFMSALVLRFVFPAFSAERRTAWILAGAPLSLSRVFWSKYAFYALSLSGLGLAIGSLNFFVLKIGLAALAWPFVLFLIALVFVVSYGLALGALYPNFETDDPAALSTSLPGLGFIMGSVLYGVLGGAAIYRYLAHGSYGEGLLFGLASILAIILLTRLAARSLDRLEYMKSTG